MPATQEDVDKARDRVNKLREQVSDARTSEAERVLAAQRDLDLASLEAEEARLKGELVTAKEAAKASTVKAGAADLLESVKDQRKAADDLAAAQAKEGDK